MKDIIKKIAQENGVKPSEVERDIKEAIEVAMQNPQTKEFWDIVCPDGTVSDVNSVIDYIAAICISLGKPRLEVLTFDI